jgi:hypothetical protein
MVGPAGFFFNACMFQLPAIAADKPLPAGMVATHTDVEVSFTPRQPAAALFSWRLVEWAAFLSVFVSRDDILQRWVADYRGRNAVDALLWLEDTDPTRVLDHACFVVVRFVASKLAAVVRDARAVIDASSSRGAGSVAARVEANACGFLLKALRDALTTHRLDLRCTMDELKHADWWQFRDVIIDRVSRTKLVQVSGAAVAAAGAGGPVVESPRVSAVGLPSAEEFAALRAENARLRASLVASPGKRERGSRDVVGPGLASPGGAGRAPPTPRGPIVEVGAFEPGAVESPPIATGALARAFAGLVDAGLLKSGDLCAAGASRLGTTQVVACDVWRPSSDPDPSKVCYVHGTHTAMAGASAHSSLTCNLIRKLKGKLTLPQKLAESLA